MTEKESESAKHCVSSNAECILAEKTSEREAAYHPFPFHFLHSTLCFPSVTFYAAKQECLSKHSLLLRAVGLPTTVGDFVSSAVSMNIKSMKVQ